MSKGNVYTSMDKRIFYLSDEIDNETIGNISFSLLSLIEDDNMSDGKEKNYKRKPIKIYINSFGGSIYDMWGLIDIISKSKTPIYTYCTGYAMSAGCAIFVSGHKRFMSPHATLMYHQMIVDSHGTYQSFVEREDEVKWHQTELENFIADKTKLTKEELQDIRKSKIDYHIHSDKAIELGFADEVL